MPPIAGPLVSPWGRVCAAAASASIERSTAASARRKSGIDVPLVERPARRPARAGIVSKRLVSLHARKGSLKRPSKLAFGPAQDRWSPPEGLIPSAAAPISARRNEKGERTGNDRCG